MDYEITHWKIPNDFHRLITGLDAMVAIMSKRQSAPELYLYEQDFLKIKRLAKSNIPTGTELGRITYRGLEVHNGGTKQSKRPVQYTEPSKRHR